MKTLKQLLEATGRDLYIDWEIAKTSPKNQKGQIEFFHIGKDVSVQELKKEYEKRGLEPAGIDILAKYDLENREEMDKMEFVGTQWGDNSYATFYRWRDGRGVLVGRSDRGWGRSDRFGGVRKSFVLESLDLEKALEIVKKAGYKIIREY
mgnify:CR=1 FL=1